MRHLIAAIVVATGLSGCTDFGPVPWKDQPIALDVRGSITSAETGLPLAADSATVELRLGPPAAEEFLAVNFVRGTPTDSTGRYHLSGIHNVKTGRGAPEWYLVAGRQHIAPDGITARRSDPVAILIGDECTTSCVINFTLPGGE